MIRVFFSFGGEARHVDLRFSVEEIARQGFWVNSKLQRPDILPVSECRYWIPPSALLHVVQLRKGEQQQ